MRPLKEWDTDSKVWNDFKSNIRSAAAYYKEFSIFTLIFLILLFLILPYTPGLVLFMAMLIFLLVALMNFVGKRRNIEINEISLTVSKIRKNFFTSPGQITLSKNLSSVQEEIQKMFEKTKADIDYLQKLEKMRAEFLANVSHELRTPIFTIQGYIETLINGAIDDKNVNKNFLDKANRHTTNLSNLLNDLIDISMMESGEMRMSYRYFNYNDFIEPLILELEPMANEKNIKLICHPAKDNLKLFGDKSRLRQVFINLIQNALKYTEAGCVEVSIEEERGSVKIIIKDTGIGISTEDISRIFERFYRVDKARSKAAGGTGLGLAIVKHILDAHGAKIEVQSHPGIGSEFAFKLKK